MYLLDSFKLVILTSASLFSKSGPFEYEINNNLIPKGVDSVIDRLIRQSGTLTNKIRLKHSFKNKYSSSLFRRFSCCKQFTQTGKVQYIAHHELFNEFVSIFHNMYDTRYTKSTVHSREINVFLRY